MIIRTLISYKWDKPTRFNTLVSYTFSNYEICRIRRFTISTKLTQQNKHCNTKFCLLSLIFNSVALGSHQSDTPHLFFIYYTVHGSQSHKISISLYHSKVILTTQRYETIARHPTIYCIRDIYLLVWPTILRCNTNPNIDHDHPSRRRNIRI